MHWRVSDEDVARHCAPGSTSHPFETRNFALDLRDARAEIVRLSGQTHYDASAEEAARLKETNAKLNRRVQEMESAAARLAKIERRIAERARGKPLGRIEAGFAIAAAETNAARWRECAEALAAALDERGEHHWSCNRADFRGGRPTESGGYEFNYGGTWYESRPVDRTPKCDCEIGEALARFDAMKEGK